MGAEDGLQRDGLPGGLVVAGDDAGGVGELAGDGIAELAGSVQPPEVEATPLLDGAVAVVIGAQAQQGAEGSEQQGGEELTGVEGCGPEHQLSLERSATRFSCWLIWCRRARRLLRSVASSHSTITSLKNRSMGACRVASCSSCWM